MHSCVDHWMSGSNWFLAKPSAWLGHLTQWLNFVICARFACVRHLSCVLCFDLLIWFFLLPLALSVSLEIAGRGDWQLTGISYPCKWWTMGCCYKWGLHHWFLTEMSCFHCIWCLPYFTHQHNSFHWFCKHPGGCFHDQIHWRPRRGSQEADAGSLSKGECWQYHLCCCPFLGRPSGSNTIKPSSKASWLLMCVNLPQIRQMKQESFGKWKP